MRNPVRITTRDLFSSSIPSGAQVTPGPSVPPSSPPPNGSGSSNRVISMSGQNVISLGLPADPATVPAELGIIPVFFIPILEADSITMLVRVIQDPGSTSTCTIQPALYDQFGATGFTTSPNIYAAVFEGGTTTLIQFDWKIDSYVTVGAISDTVMTLDVDMSAYDVHGPHITTHFLLMDSSTVLGATPECRITTHVFPTVVYPMGA